MQELKKKKEEDAKLMPPPSLPGMDQSDAPDSRSKSEKRKDQRILNKIVKPKGWNKNWSKGEQSNQVRMSVSDRLACSSLSRPLPIFVGI